MNFLILILSVIVILKDVIISDFVPSIAFHPDLPLLYFTEQGWIKFENQSLSMKNVNETVKFCQIAYHDKNITNAVPLFNVLSIKNWCNDSKICPKYNASGVHQFQCIDSTTYKPQKIHSTADCNLRNGGNTVCQTFESLKENATTQCKNENSVLFDFKVVFSKFVCLKVKMRFLISEFVCCPIKGKQNQKNYDSGFTTNNMTHIEQILLKRKKILETNAKKVKSLERKLQSQIHKIIIENPNKIISERLFNNISQTFKRQFVNIMEKFSETFFKKEKFDIERIINRSEAHCDNEMMKTCDTNLGSLIENLRIYYKQICINKDIEILGCKSFIVEQLQKLKLKYAKENKSLSISFNSTITYLTSRPTFNSYEELFQVIFNKNKKEAFQNLDQTSHTHGAPVMSIVVTILILFILLVLTCLATLVMKYCDQPFRRGTPNYVMSVVFNTNPNPGANHKPSQQSTNMQPNQHSVKLNLYENPIFNAKSASKPSEKQSLIENMES